MSGDVVAVDKSIDTAVIRAEEGAAADLKPFVLGALTWFLLRTDHAMVMGG